MTERLALLVCVGWLAATVPMPAHHNFASEFDASKPVTVTGAVTRLEWKNPHVWFYVDAKSDAGEVSSWGMEMGSPNGLIRRRVDPPLDGRRRRRDRGGIRARNGATIANARTVTLTKTGQKLFAASSQGQ